MIRNRLRTKVASTVAAVAILIGLIVVPTSLGATANLTLNGGTAAAGTKISGHTPDAVSPGKVAGFYVTVKNTDTSNLPTFFMSAASNGTPFGAYWFDTSDPGTAHACQTSPLSCNFGTFNSGTEVTVVAAFTLPSSASSSTKNCYPSNPTSLQFGVAPTSSTFVCVDFKFSSSQGNVPGKNHSRGDEFHWMDWVSTDVDARNEAAQFPYCDASGTNSCDANLLSLNNNTTLSTNQSRFNVQYTRVTVPASAFDSDHATTAIHVQDGIGTATPGCDATCQAFVDANGGFLGEVSQIDINSGQSFAPDWIVTTIGMLGVNANKIDGVVHDNGTSADILGKCPSSAGPDESTPDVGCFWAVSGGGNTAIVTVYTHTNGKLRNF